MRRFAAPLIALALLVAAVAGSPAPSGAATPSEPDRVAWRIKVPLDYFFHTPGIGPDGTIYVPNLYGRTGRRSRRLDQVDLPRGRHGKPHLGHGRRHRDRCGR